MQFVFHACFKSDSVGLWSLIPLLCSFRIIMRTLENMLPDSLRMKFWYKPKSSNGTISDKINRSTNSYVSPRQMIPWWRQKLKHCFAKLSLPSNNICFSPGGAYSNRFFFIQISTVTKRTCKCLLCIEMRILCRFSDDF